MRMESLRLKGDKIMDNITNYNYLKLTSALDKEPVYVRIDKIDALWLDNDGDFYGFEVGKTVTIVIISGRAKAVIETPEEIFDLLQKSFTEGATKILDTIKDLDIF